MTWSFTLAVRMIAADDQRVEFGDTLQAVAPDAAAVRVDELSTQRGDGIFETITAVDGQALAVSAHLERLAHSARLCDLPAPHFEQWRAAITVAAAQCPPGQCVIRLAIVRAAEASAAPAAWVTATKAADFSRARRDGIAVVTLERGIDSGVADRAPWLLLGAKTLSYAVNMAAIREARRRGADDAIFVSSDGLVMEGPTSSVIARIDGEYVTPEPGTGILRGTTQLRVFDFLAARGERSTVTTLPVGDLTRVDALWLVSSVRSAAPVVALDGQPLTPDQDLTEAMNEYLLSPGAGISPRVR